jgi:TPR repeat protein
VLEIAKYYAWAEVFYTRAAEQDYSAAITNLGFMYRAGVGRPVDHAKAVALYSRAADLGNLRARTNLGTAYMRGQGVPKLPEEGILWYRLAASGGWPNAVNALANAYLKGDGVAKDPPLAARLYAEAVAGGQIDAMSSLGVLYVSGTGVDKDVQKGLATLLEATRLGNRFAPLHAARVLLKGEDGIEKDPRRAEELMQRAAERGFVNAYGDLAKAYRDGAFGGGKSPERAYYYAVLAERTEAPDGADLKASLAGDLPEAERERIEESADVFLRQNGD